LIRRQVRLRRSRTCIAGAKNFSAVGVFSLDFEVSLGIIKRVVKCPICNAKIAFSLPMHMHMAHGPGGKAENNGENPNDSKAAQGPMNQMRVIQPPKRRGRKRVVRRRRT
jgi:hypothetical protein